MRKNLFEGLEQSVIDNTLNNIYANLEKIAKDKRNGHAFHRHADKDDDYLLNRIAQGNTAATSYYDVDIAIRATLAAIRKNWKSVTEFLQTNESETCLEINASKGIGYGYLKNVEGVFEDCHKAIIVLQKDENVPWGFYVKTSYPVITKDLVPDMSVCM